MDETSPANLGFLYVLSNPGMPGLIKIGLTQDDPWSRANALFSTGVPHPFLVERAFFVRDVIALEAAVHERLKDARVPSNREFFTISADEAIEWTEDLIAEHVVLQVYRDAFEIESIRKHLLENTSVLEQAVEKALKGRAGVKQEDIDYWNQRR